MIILPALINGKSYEAQDISCMVGGIMLTTIQALNYMDDQNITPVYGSGSRVVSYGKGQVKTEGSITLLMEDVVNMVSASPTGRIQDFPPFDIIISFTDAALITQVHRLKNCLFRTNKIDTKSGDTSIPVEIPLFIGDIKWK